MGSTPTATAFVLDPEMLEDWAGSEVFDRGERLLDAVTITTGADTQVHGLVQGTSRYRVSFRLSGGQVQAYCSCPHSERGFFCEHLVALGLVIIADARAPGELSFDDDAFEDAPGEVIGEMSAPATVDMDPVDVYLADLDRPGLLQVIAAARATIPEFALALQELAAQTGVEDEGIRDDDVETHIKNLITDACRVGPFVDYHRAGEVADQLIEVLEEIEALALAGHQKALVKQSRRFVDRISRILELADDSDGFIGEVFYHAAALHAFICTTGEADPAKLVDWILKVQLQGPGWPEISITDFWPILTDRAKTRYRRGLETALETSRQGEGSNYARQRASAHLVEFADAAGDVDLAVGTLTQYGNLREAYYRFVQAERPGEADALFQDMLGEWTGMPGHRLGAEEIVDKLLSENRVEEAETFIRQELRNHQSLQNYLFMVRVGEHTGRDLRAQARRLVTSVVTLQEVLMHEGETEALWDLVLARDSLVAPDSVIRYFEDNDAGRALELLIRLGMTAAAGPATKSTYRAAAGYLTRAKKLGPTSTELAQAVTEIRNVHYRRTSMLKIFDQHGL